MISVCAICHSRQKSEVVRIAQLEAEVAKLEELAKAVVDEHEAMVSEWGGSDTIEALAALLGDK